MMREKLKIYHFQKGFQLAKDCWSVTKYFICTTHHTHHEHRRFQQVMRHITIRIFNQICLLIDKDLFHVVFKKMKLGTFYAVSVSRTVNKYFLNSDKTGKHFRLAIQFANFLCSAVNIMLTVFSDVFPLIIVRSFHSNR
jgi:uncharacterized membrane protein